MEKTVDGKKEVKYDFNYRLAHLLLWNEDKEAGVVWWDDSLLCCFVCIACAIGESTNFCLLTPALPLHVVCGGNRDRN